MAINTYGVKTGEFGQYDIADFQPLSLSIFKLVNRCQIGYYKNHDVAFVTTGCDVFVMTGYDKIRYDTGWLAHFFNRFLKQQITKMEKFFFSF